MISFQPFDAITQWAPITQLSRPIGLYWTRTCRSSHIHWYRLRTPILYMISMTKFALLFYHLSRKIKSWTPPFQLLKLSTIYCCYLDWNILGKLHQCHNYCWCPGCLCCQVIISSEIESTQYGYMWLLHFVWISTTCISLSRNEMQIYFIRFRTISVNSLRPNFSYMHQ